MKRLFWATAACKWEKKPRVQVHGHTILLRTTPSERLQNASQGTEYPSQGTREEDCRLTRAKSRRPSTVDWTANPLSLWLAWELLLYWWAAPHTKKKMHGLGILCIRAFVRGPDKPGATSCVCVADRRLGHPRCIFSWLMSRFQIFCPLLTRCACVARKNRYMYLYV